MRIITARKRSLGQGNMFTGVCLSTGGCLVPGGCLGVSGPGGVPALGGLVWGCLVETPRTATTAGGTHPTGMDSCFLAVHTHFTHLDIHGYFREDCVIVQYTALTCVPIPRLICTIRRSDRIR